MATNLNQTPQRSTLGKRKARCLDGTFPQRSPFRTVRATFTHPAQHFQIRLGLRSVA